MFFLFAKYHDIKVLIKEGANMNAYLYNGRINTRRNTLPVTHIGDNLINVLCAIVAFFTSAVAVKIEKAVLSTALFIAFFGVIGSMESGSIGLFVGALLNSAIILAEYFILRSLSVKKADKK